MDSRPIHKVVYAIPLETKRISWVAAVAIGGAGAVLGLIFGFILMVVTSRAGRLPLPQSVALQAFFPVAAIWWHTVGKVLGANTLVFFGQYSVYGFFIGLLAPRGYIKRAMALVLLVHVAAYSICVLFGLR